MIDNNYNNYVEIPNTIVWDSKDNKSLIRILKNNKDGKISTYKIIQLLYGLCLLTDPFRNICRFTLDGLMQVSKIKVNKDYKDNIKDCKEILNKFNVLGFFKENKIKFLEIKITDWIVLEPNFYTYDDEKIKVNYFQLYDYELNKILSYNKKKISNGELLTLFCYYAARMYHRGFYTNSEGKETKTPLGLGKPEVCYPKYDEIERDIGISKNVVKKYNDILSNLGLIICKNAGDRRLQFEDNILTLSSSNTIALCRNGKDIAEAEVDNSISSFRSGEKAKGIIFIGDKRKKKEMSKKQNSNTIIRLQAIQKTKGLTKQQEKKLNMCLLKKQDFDVIETSVEDIKWQNQMLLSNNRGKLLSTIFDDLGRDREYEHYRELEYDLGLVDEDDNLQVEWDYYKWVMVNYTKNKHTKFVEYVQKEVYKDSWGEKQPAEDIEDDDDYADLPY